MNIILAVAGVGLIVASFGIGGLVGRAKVFSLGVALVLWSIGLIG